jgi:hypothetical protein
MRQKMMKKITALFLTAVLLISFAACGSSAPQVEADYMTPKEAILAARGGTDITGKTIAVKASFDSRSGVIYAVPDTSIMASIYITIISDGSNTDEVLSIKEGETVVVTVDMYDDHLEKSLYIYAKEYKLYR